MRLLTVLPDADVPDQDLTRALALINDRFAEADDRGLAAPAAGLALFQGRVTEKIAAYRPGTDEAGADITVYVAEAPPKNAIQWRHGQRAYHYQINRLELGGRGPFRLLHPESLDEAEYPFIHTHVFNKLSSHQAGFANFPFGCLYLDPEIGPVNDFGHRIREDLAALTTREPDHKLACVFGGSAAFSVYCQYDEMFAKRLEARLNAHFAEKGARVRFTVLNFGMHDNVVLQEMVTWLLFAQALKPDFVISHSAHNDFWYGLRNDPYLVAHHDLVYQGHSEFWSHILHSSEIVPPRMPKEFNLKQNVLKACIARHRQFADLVADGGGTFIWGIQPLMWSKGALHPREEAFMEGQNYFHRVDPHSRKFYDRIRVLYDALSQDLPDDAGVLDFHKLFQDMGADRELMWDHVHTNPEGDEVIATAYAGRILAALGEG